MLLVCAISSLPHKLAGGLGHDSEPAKGLAGEVELCRHQGPGNDDAGLPCS